MPQPPLEIHLSNFSLNVSGVAGFFGGDEAIGAIQTIHHYKARKFLGWYNSPGSWNVGKNFGKLAKSDWWDGLFPGPDEEPAKFFELDGKEGPKYIASRSGTILEHTGHLAYLIMQMSKGELGLKVEEGRITKCNKVTIIKTQRIFTPEVELAAEEKGKPPDCEILPCSRIRTAAAVLPMAVSFTTCAICGCTYDWFCFSMILLGIVSNGIFSLVMGSARLKLQGVNSASSAPPGDGMLMDGDNIVLLRGEEKHVATITRGRFILEYDPWVKWRSKKATKKRPVLGDRTRSSRSGHHSDVEEGQSEQLAVPQTEVAVPIMQGVTSPNPSLPPGEEPILNEYNAIGLSSLLLVIQLLAQLLLIPQGTLFGQIMFLISFAVSWVYNLYLSAINNDDIQDQLIREELHLEGKHMRTYIFRTRTSAAVFASLMLQPADGVTGKYADADWKGLGFKPENIIRSFIPNDTQVWDTWREKVLEVMKKRDGSEDICHRVLQMSSEEEMRFEKDDRDLLKVLLKGALIAYDRAMEEQRWLGEN